MARSYRHTAIMGVAGTSDKWAKAAANRVLRHHVRQMLHMSADYDKIVLPVMREVSDVWGFPKDGKHYMRSTDRFYAECMRK